MSNNIGPFFREFAFSDFVYRKTAFPKREIDAYIAAQARPGRLDAGFGYYRALQKAEPFFAQTVAPPWPFPVLTLDGDHSFNGLTVNHLGELRPIQLPASFPIVVISFRRSNRNCQPDLA